MFKRHSSSTALGITNLQWAMGAFCCAMGALMLVAPHQFEWPAFAWLQPQLTTWAVGFLAVGAGLLAVFMLAPGLRLTMLAHCLAGCLMLVLAAGFVRIGVYSGALTYLVLGLGTAAAPVLVRLRPFRSIPRAEALSLLVGFGAFLSGVVLLAVPGAFAAARYDLARPFLGWFGLAFVAAAALLGVSQMRRVARPSIQRWAGIPLGVALMVFGVITSAPNHDWTSGLYYGGFGTALVLLSAFGTHLRRLDPRSLHTRLAWVLAAAVAVPLVVMVSGFAHDQSADAVSGQLGRQQALAGALAQDVSDYINLHQAALRLLASQPGLLALSATAQHAVLQAGKAAYPDIRGFGTVSAAGEPVARSDDRAGTSFIGDPMFEAVRGTNQPSLQILVSPIIHQPIFSMGAPVLDADGRFVGLVAGSLEAARLATYLSRPDFGPDARSFLVDASGRVIAHPDPDLVARFADLSSRPSVAALLADPGQSGSLRVAGPDGGVLASYAHVPDLGWGVVVEQPASAGLAAIRSKLDLVFGGVLLMIAAAAGFGVIAAAWFTGPLVTLAVAVDRLATGDSSAPLPVSGLTEIAGLAATLGHLRKQLDARTAERELAEEALKHRVLHDALTGLPNRSLFTDRMEHAVARVHREATLIAVMFLDLDDFKSVNDRFGHEQGDALLLVVAERLRACMRATDTAARIGGDEFTVLLEDVAGRNEAIVVAERIAAELAVPIKLANGEVIIRASIGIAVGESQCSARELLHQADLAMYRAKRYGARRCYEVFDSQLERTRLETSS